MKYLVTGGAGFIGSNFIRYILGKYKDAQVFNIDKLAYGSDFNNLKDFSDERYKHIKKDICNLDAVCETIEDNKIDLIVHFAAATHVDTSIVSGFEKNKYEAFKEDVDSGDFVLNNVWGTQTLLKAAIRTGVTRFHHISTDEVFGDLPLNTKDKFTENSPYNPSSPYSASKAASDHLVRAYVRTYGLKATISNCSNNYGPYQHVEKLIPKIITLAQADKKIPVYGQGINVRDWIHVDDHNAAVDFIIQKGKTGETYLIGGNTERANIDVVREILKILGKPESLVEFVKDRPGHDLRYAIDASKLQTELGWKPQYDFEAGLKQTIKWYQDHASNYRI